MTTTSPRLIFAGTPEFAVPSLRLLVADGYSPAAVYTQPDRPAGRGRQPRASPVKIHALAAGIPTRQPVSLRDPVVQAELAALAPDLLVVAAYGLILPPAVLAIPRLGCVNVHASLLPRWRGAAPIQRAIVAGDAQTGVTIMQMDAGLDTGDMLLAQALPIGPRTTTASLHDELAALGGQLIVQALQQAAQGRLRPTPQPAEGVCYAHKIDKHEAAIDWHQPAAQIERRIRAFDPFPGASSQLGDTVVKLWSSEIDSCSRPSDARCGQILAVDEGGIAVACADAVLRLTELQRPGGKRLPAREFLRGFALAPGQCLGEGTGGAP